MFGVARRSLRSTARGLVVGASLTGITLALYTISVPRSAHLDSHSATCTGAVPESWQQHRTNPSTSTSSGQVCSPKVDIMFMKTHKTGSSTLQNILFRFGEKHKLKFAFPDGRNDFLYPSPFSCSQVKGYHPGECFNILCNHMRFDFREVSKLLPASTAYVTILRHPVDLFESAFHYYHHAVPLTWSIRGEKKLAEFLHQPQAFYSPGSYNSFYLKNLLFFDLGFDNNLRPDDPRVDQAITMLSQQFHLVLITEYFDESLILLQDLLCWSQEDLLYVKMNARRPSSVSPLSSALRAKALEWNAADWKLYQYFNATFWAKVETYGRWKMRREVKELRRRNTVMRGICMGGQGAVEAPMIQDRSLLPWQPFGESSILGYNLRTDIQPKYRTLCRKMLTPEIQYLSELGVSLWLTRLWGLVKDAIY